ncbi:peptide-methionine (S)-S-oxide reductase MsrA [Arcanobacterium urinimassiliense]|uniref:peptide-methionine (S)-S-oxide reductase MsrA n=1 Tax=Arcanobacterium urinimassiliense TaxID=1871014 RepID=UPI000AAE8DFC|nr:peptide-methionine (S)-S-oxide reductase MsrA [Arcanobacterium urinimassiliense]
MNLSSSDNLASANISASSDSLNNSDNSANSATIYLAAGCFWGVEEIYQYTPGILDTSVGYMGGTFPHPSYEDVCSGTTGHAETVCVTFDTESISAAKILQIFWECHDPTSRDRQGNDRGSQYRSLIFYTSASQEKLAKEMRQIYQQQLLRSGRGEIVTDILPAATYKYYLAEEYHQNYLQKHPQGYRCHSRTGVACPLPNL